MKEEKNILPPENEVLAAINSIRYNHNRSMKGYMKEIYMWGNEQQKRFVLKALKEYTDFEEQFDFALLSEKDIQKLKYAHCFSEETESKMFTMYYDVKWRSLPFFR